MRNRVAAATEWKKKPKKQKTPTNRHSLQVPSPLRSAGWERLRRGECCKCQLKKAALTRPLLHFALLRYKFSRQLFHSLVALFACRFRDIHGCRDNREEPLRRRSHFKMPRPFLQSQAIHCGNITLIESHQPLHLKSWNPCATMRSGILQREDTR